MRHTNLCQLIKLLYYFKKKVLSPNQMVSNTASGRPVKTLHRADVPSYSGDVVGGGDERRTPPSDKLPAREWSSIKIFGASSPRTGLLRGGFSCGTFFALPVPRFTLNFLPPDTVSVSALLSAIRGYSKLLVIHKWTA